MKTKNALYSALMACTSCLLTMNAYAQSTSQPSTTGDNIETVVVTSFISKGSFSATKVNAPIRDVPMSVSSYSKDFMKAINTTEIADLYRYMTGLERSGNTGYDMVIRGFATSADTDRNALMVDGLPGLTVRFGSPPTIGVDHIEVVKGSASLLYGLAIPGGFVNIITKKPQASPLAEIRVTGTAEERQSGYATGIDAAADFTGPLDSEGKFLYRVVGELGDTSHFRTASYERPIYLAPSFTWNISDNTSATLQLEYRYVDTSYDSYLVAPNLDITKVASIYTRYQQPNDNQTETGQTATLSLVHAFDDGITWNFHYRYVGHRDTAEGFDVVKFWPGNTSLQRRARGQRNWRTYSFGDTYLNIPLQTGFIDHKIIVGGQYGVETADFRRLQFYNAPEAPNPLSADIAVYNPDYTTALPLSSYPIGPINEQLTTNTSYGVYISDLLTFSEHWKAMAGVRYDYQKQVLVTYKPNVATATSISPATTPGEAVLPMAGLIYQPNKHLSFYTSYSTAYLPQAAGSIDVNGNGNFAPTKGTSYEVGSKDTFWDGRANVTVAAFDIEETNVLNDFNCPTYGTCSAPVGQERSKGVELEVDANPFRGLQLAAGYAYTDATVSATNSATAYQLGARLANVPTNNAHIWTRYTIPEGSLEGFGVGLGVTYNSERDGTLPVDASKQVLKLPGYTLTDLAFYVPYKNLDLTFKISNLFDNVYYEYATRSGIVVQPGTPRTFSIVLDTHL